jgi:stage V sporulation protein SpoVS
MGAIDGGSELAKLSRRVRQLETQSGNDGAGFGGGGDSDHLGTGAFSVQIGDAAEALGSRSVAIGQASYADSGTGGGGYSTALGPGTYANADGTAVGANAFAAGVESVAIGDGASAYGLRAVAIGRGASAPNENDFILGSATHNVVVNGTFSNPSARRLKENITDVPELVSIFPPLYEWEYIVGDGRRHIGPMADDLVGTDAERFLIRDAAGEPASIQTVALLVAQVAQLHARVVALEEELRG